MVRRRQVLFGFLLDWLQLELFQLAFLADGFRLVGGFVDHRPHHRLLFEFHALVKQLAVGEESVHGAANVLSRKNGYPHAVYCHPHLQVFVLDLLLLLPLESDRLFELLDRLFCDLNAVLEDLDFVLGLCFLLSEDLLLHALLLL